LEQTDEAHKYVEKWLKKGHVIITLEHNKSKKEKEKKMKNPNPIQFYAGLILALGSAAWTFFGSFHPSHTIILIIGIGLIATSKYRLLK
jgi:hypothetical protein